MSDRNRYASDDLIDLAEQLRRVVESSTADKMLADGTTVLVTDWVQIAQWVASRERQRIVELEAEISVARAGIPRSP